MGMVSSGTGKNCSRNTTERVARFERVAPLERVVERTTDIQDVLKAEGLFGIWLLYGDSE